MLPPYRLKIAVWKSKVCNIVENEAVCDDKPSGWGPKVIQLFWLVIKSHQCVFFFFSVQMSSPTMVRPLLICPWKKSLCVLAMKSWLKWTIFCQLIVGYGQGLLDQQLRPRPIHLFSIIIIINYIKLHILKLNSLMVSPTEGCLAA